MRRNCGDVRRVTLSLVGRGCTKKVVNPCETSHARVSKESAKRPLQLNEPLCESSCLISTNPGKLSRHSKPLYGQSRGDFLYGERCQEGNLHVTWTVLFSGIISREFATCLLSVPIRRAPDNKHCFRRWPQIRPRSPPARNLERPPADLQGSCRGRAPPPRKHGKRYVADTH